MLTLVSKMGTDPRARPLMLLKLLFQRYPKSRFVLADQNDGRTRRDELVGSDLLARIVAISERNGSFVVTMGEPPKHLISRDIPIELRGHPDPLRNHSFRKTSR